MILINKLNQDLINAVESKNLLEVKRLFELGADIHYENDDALKISISLDNLPITLFLLEKGSIIDNPIYLASLYKSFKVMDYLIESNKYKLDFKEAMEACATSGNVESIKYLVMIKNIDINLIELKKMHKKVFEWTEEYKLSKLIERKNKLEKELSKTKINNKLIKI